jgi:hypothetical protein
MRKRTATKQEKDHKTCYKVVLSKGSGENLSIPVEDSMGESHQERRFSTR